MQHNEPVVAPLDAYETAKPDEPTFTLQGGDPLGWPLTEVWSDFARMRAGVLTEEGCTAAFMRLVSAARDNKAPNEREVHALLLRASKAEEVSWSMKEYFKGVSFAAEEVVAADAPLEEKERIDLHDYRIRAAQRVNNAEGDLVEIIEELTRRGFTKPISVIEEAVKLLRSISQDIEPRRLMKNA